MCSTRTQGPTMRASIADLILAANTSHIILYKENIEGETVTGRGTAASNKGPCHTLGLALTREGRGSERKIGGRKPFLLFCCPRGIQRPCATPPISGPRSGREVPCAPRGHMEVSEAKCQTATLGPMEGVTSAACVPSRSVASDTLRLHGL